MDSNPKLAEVVSIDDPDQAGRSQIRVFGIHDDKINVPDKDLPWASKMKGTNDPAINKIGTGGNGLLVGTHVFVRPWDHKDGNQHWYIIGSVPKSGDNKSGSSNNSKPEIDKTKSDLPTASRGNDKNTVVSNPIKDSKTTPGTKGDDENPKNIYDDIMKKGAKFANLPTIATEAAAKNNIINLIKSIDPTNSSGILPSALSGLSKLVSIDQLTSPQGINDLVSKALGTTLVNLTKTFGVENVVGLLGSVLASNNPQNVNTSTGQYQFTEDPDLLEILQMTLIIMGEKLDEVPTVHYNDKMDDIAMTVIEELIIYAHDELHVCLEDGVLLKETILKLLRDLIAQAKASGEEKVLGTTQSNALNNVSSNLPSVGDKILSTITSYVVKTVLDESKIKDSLKAFTKSQMLLNKKEDALKTIFSGDGSIPSKLTNDLLNAGFKSLKNLVDPATGNKI